MKQFHQRIKYSIIKFAVPSIQNLKSSFQFNAVPDGLFVDSDNETIFWTDTDFKTIESIQFDGSNQRVLINDVDMPRAIIIVPENRFDIV